MNRIQIVLSQEIGISVALSVLGNFVWVGEFPQVEENARGPFHSCSLSFPPRLVISENAPTMSIQFKSSTINDLVYLIMI